MTTPPRFEREIKMNLETGLHARPAGILVKVANQFAANIEIWKSEQRKNAKSVMSLMSLGASHGDSLKIVAEGDDAHEAGVAIEKLFSNRFQLET